MASQERDKLRPFRVTIIYMVEERTRKRLQSLCEQLLECGIDVFVFSDDMTLVESHEAEMQKQIEQADAVIICFSENFNNEGRGYRHQEVRIAKEEQRKRPPGNAYLITINLDKCPVPPYLSEARVLDYFRKEHFDGIMRWGLVVRRDQLIKGGEKIQEFKYHLPQKDFFISYAHQDQQQAKWMSQQLEEAGYSTILPDRNLLPEGDAIPQIDNAARQAKRTIAVLSPHSLASAFTQSEWEAALHQDPTGAQGLLLPVRVLLCDVGGLLAPLTYIDLVGQEDKEEARKIFLSGIAQTPKTLKPAEISSLVIPTEQSRFGEPFPEHWNVARRHAPYFTGRDEQIQRIFRAFVTRDEAQVPEPQALVGLGGLGKTQTAAEYAYRYRKHYKAVFWARADNKENLKADYHSLIDLLGLPKEENPIETMQRWFTSHSDWLLILDNADDLKIIDPFLPRSQPGHVLLTTRVRAASNVAQPLLLEPLNSDDGALCILRRAGSIPRTGQLGDASPSRTKAAKRIAELMDGLPLALEQAGAYIEDTGNTESRYLKIYEEFRAQVLQRQFGALPNYPLPVATAWKFSKRVVQETDAAAFEMLQLCAFLAPDAIPEEIFIKSAQTPDQVFGPEVTNAFDIDATTIILRRYSLLNREVKGEKEIPQFSMHRMMQEILKDEMDEATKQLWAERAVRAVSHALDFVEEHIIQAHVYHCIPLIKQWDMTFPEAERLQQYAEETHTSSDR